MGHLDQVMGRLRPMMAAGRRDIKENENRSQTLKALPC